jgi:hypothetical protein
LIMAGREENAGQQDGGAFAADFGCNQPGARGKAEDLGDPPCFVDDQPD